MAGDLAYCTASEGIPVRFGRLIRRGTKCTVMGPSEDGNIRDTHVRILFSTGERWYPSHDDVPATKVWPLPAWNAP